MKYKVISVLLALMFFVTSGFSQQKNPLALADPHAIDWFKEAKFGIFVHWGLYSILEGSYDGTILTPEVDKKKFPNGQTWYAEWIQMRLDVPNNVYQNLAKSFNPVNFDADAWIREVKNAGARYFVITSKHHDGFALWDSKVSDFDIMNTPFKRDILAEIVAACKKYGIKYGFYYSHWQDWEHPQGALPEWKEQRSDKEFQKYWEGKCLPQVKELITKFDPDLLWFDTWGTEGVHITPERRDELIALVRANSKKCLINGRISFTNPGDNIDFLEMMDNNYPEGIQARPWQTPATMVHSWGWHAHDFSWKPTSEMLGYLVNNTAKGGNYLLNIGPKPDGTFPVPAVRRLKEMGAWLYANGEAVYGAHPVKMDIDDGICLTQKVVDGKNILYITLTRPFETVYLPLDASKISDSRILETDMPIEFTKRGDMTRFVLPSSLFKDTSLQVIKVTLNSDL